MGGAGGVEGVFIQLRVLFVDVVVDGETSFIGKQIKVELNSY